MGRAFLVFGLLGCGRLGFDQTTSTDDAAITGDVASTDAMLVTPPGCVMALAMNEASWTGVTGEVEDSCGSNHGTAIGGAITISDPERGQVGKFIGGTSCVVIPDAPALRIADQLTASAWIRPIELSPNSFGVISKRTDFGVATEYSIFIWADNGGSGMTNHLYVDIDTENDRIDDPNAAYPDIWRQITVVYDGRLSPTQRTTFYVDGAESFVSPETSETTVTPANPADLAIGCLPLSGLAQSMVGLIDDVVIWKRALSANEVAVWHTLTKR